VLPINGNSFEFKLCHLRSKGMQEGGINQAHLNTGIILTDMERNIEPALEEFVTGVLQLAIQCDTEEYELRAIRKISRKQTRMIRKAKENMENRMLAKEGHRV